MRHISDSDDNKGLEGTWPRSFDCCRFAIFNGLCVNLRINTHKSDVVIRIDLNNTSANLTHLIP